MSKQSLDLYTRCSHQTSAAVIKCYSTSFSTASALLPKPVARDIASIYALVRLADETVDGTAIAAGLKHDQVASALDELETEVYQAFNTGFSTNLTVHAFADVCRRCCIPKEFTRSFFHSMRQELSVFKHSAESLKTYIYGSAEVVGLMCLHAFYQGSYHGDDQELNQCAQSLGAAFQKVNFLRDLASDQGELKRIDFPELLEQPLDENIKSKLVAEIQHDLDNCKPGLWRLPARIRISVGAAHDLFQALNNQIDRASAAEVRSARIRVDDKTKAMIIAKAAIRYGNPRRTSDCFDFYPGL